MSTSEKAISIAGAALTGASGLGVILTDDKKLTASITLGLGLTTSVFTSIVYETQAPGKAVAALKAIITIKKGLYKASNHTLAKEEPDYNKAWKVLRRHVIIATINFDRSREGLDSDSIKKELKKGKEIIDSLPE